MSMGELPCNHVISACDAALRALSAASADRLHRVEEINKVTALHRLAAAVNKNANLSGGPRIYVSSEDFILIAEYYP